MTQAVHVELSNRGDAHYGRPTSQLYRRMCGNLNLVRLVVTGGMEIKDHPSPHNSYAHAQKTGDFSSQEIKLCSHSAYQKLTYKKMKIDLLYTSGISLF